MTRINRLTVQGFKSFAHKTDIIFDQKFNCILGPNGSGKSNLSEGLCFVLGRLSAKSMRAEKASNLIFNGGKSKKPADKCQVEIVFDNQTKIFPYPDSEVLISRTITKTGNSIYRINNKKHTRTEVLDVLGSAKINPEGYNIIQQGDINRFVDMNSQDRRKIIEEISDVSLYEEKKHKALLELTKVDEKLNDADIILKERNTYLKELKKDRDQALKFKELKDKISSNKATFLNIQIEEKNKVKKEYEDYVASFQNKIKDTENKINTLKDHIQKSKDEIKKLNQEIEQKGEKEQLKVHKDLEELKVDIAKNKTRVSNLKDELTKIAQRKQQFNTELVDLDNKLKELEKQKIDLNKQLANNQVQQSQIEEKIIQFRKKNKLEDSPDLEKEIENQDKLIEQKQEEIQKIRTDQQNIFREKDKLEFQLQSIDDQIKKVKEVEKENQKQINELKQLKENFKKLTQKLNESIDLDSSFSAQVSSARKKLQSLEEQQAKLKTQSLSAKEKLFYNQAIKRILEQKDKIKGIHGTISQLGKVNRKYGVPLEISAGSRANYIVVDNERVASECIRYLKQNKFGTASFIPLNKIKPQDISSEDKKFSKLDGVHDFALNLIDFDSSYQKAFAYVFGNTLVVDNLDVAQKIGIGRIKMVTLDGDLAEIAGVMRGGFRGKELNSSFQEKESQDQLTEVESAIGENQSILQLLESKREANEKEIFALRNKRSELEGEIIRMERVLHLDTSDLDASNQQKEELVKLLAGTESKLNQIQKDINIINKDLAELKTKRQLAKNKISLIKDPSLLAQLSAFEESKTKFREELATLKNEIKNIDLKITEMIIPEKNKIQDILKLHQKEEEKFNKEIKQLEELSTGQDKELAVKEKESKEFYSKYKELFNLREKHSNDCSHKEEEIEKLRDGSRSYEIEINKVSLKNAEIKARLAGLEQEFSQYKDAPLIKNKSEEEIKAEINKFESMLSQMSAVNMKALEIYEQVESEYTKLMEKKEKLHQEKGDIVKLMDEVELMKKTQFLKTFNVINTNFQRIFSTLFKKGDAHLELENPEKPFEEGLNVKVKLTGNRFMDIKSLSGGEKTLTALSFIFSIQEHQPASFYILDEIDAALDKHNSETLAKLIREYSNNAQYIAISHNDSLISEADVLYGVSMNPEGISKVVSLKI